MSYSTDESQASSGEEFLNRTAGFPFESIEVRLIET